MAKSRGRKIPLTPFRKLVTDLMYFSGKVPSVTADRRMNLAEVADARRFCTPHPSWVVLFTKAYALTAREYPELRRAYMRFPRPHLYEHPHTIATVNIERETELERIVLYCLIRSPENRSISEIEAIIRHHRDTPLEQLRSYKRAVAVSNIPWPLRHLFWWSSLNMSGRRRAHNYGTFGLSSVGAQGAGLLKLIPILTSTVHYGMFDEDSKVDVRLSWDHRVMDGATVARSMVDFEQILNREIAMELRGMRVIWAA